MPELNSHRVHARALLSDIEQSPDILLTRRETLTKWLNDFLLRADVPAYRLQETEAADLDDLDRYLRQVNVPVADGVRLAS